jgi:endonuclease/exonuclease/phosphatase family metal-dependent hydrolase
MKDYLYVWAFDRHFFSNQVPKDILEWSTRAPKLLEKILEASPDIVCLQELNHYGKNGVLSCPTFVNRLVTTSFDLP